LPSQLLSSSTVFGIPDSSPRAIGPPKWLQRTCSCVTSVAASACLAAAMSDGKTEQSPVYSMIIVGIVTPFSERSSDALELRPDQVESHDSGVVSRPNPPTPKFDIDGLGLITLP